MATRSTTRRFWTLSAVPALLAGLALPVPAAAHDRHEDAGVHVEIHGDDGRSLTVNVGGWAADIVRAALPAVVHCDVDRDEKVVAVLSFLDRHGDGSRYTVWDDDGRQFTGSRRGGRFELRVSGHTGWRHGRAHIEAPWGLARCMLGGTVAIGDLIEGGGSGLDVLVAGDDGRVHVSLH
jgi:hypothetical protein